jgi:carbon-monoxide dehydrogenase small subunit
VKAKPEPVDSTCASVRVSATLLHALRAAGDTSVKLGCEEGHCGACMVLVSGSPRYACLGLPPSDGTSVETAASLAGSADGARVVRALADAGAVQCGYCTPGLAVTLTHLLRQESLDEDRVRAALESHHCRCTGYYAFLRAASALRRSAEPRGAERA